MRQQLCSVGNDFWQKGHCLIVGYLMIFYLEKLFIGTHLLNFDPYDFFLKLLDWSLKFDTLSIYSSFTQFIYQVIK